VITKYPHLTFATLIQNQKLRREAEGISTISLIKHCDCQSRITSSIPPRHTITHTLPCQLATSTSNITAVPIHSAAISEHPLERTSRWKRTHYQMTQFRDQVSIRFDLVYLFSSRRPRRSSRFAKTSRDRVSLASLTEHPRCCHASKVSKMTRPEQ
jgi:hypothetical protein